MPPVSERDFGKWQYVAGSDLDDAISRGVNLRELLLECQAVYVWRRVLTPPARALEDSEFFKNWIERSMGVPLAELRDRQLAHFAVLGRLSIGGSPLSREKHDVLGHMLSAQKWRRFLAQFLAGLSQFCPPLYVGETGNLPLRVLEHMTGESGFGSKISRVDSGLAWTELELAYCPLGHPVGSSDVEKDLGRSKRSLLEALATNYSLAGYVDRRG